MHTTTFSPALAMALGLLLAGPASAGPAAGDPRTPAQPSSSAATVAPAPAAASRSQPAASAPMGGRGFGEHVSSMAPEHPLEFGAMFGQCVSEMAITGECEHMPMP